MAVMGVNQQKDVAADGLVIGLPQFQAFAETSLDGYLLLDEQGKVLSCNARAAAMLGKAACDVLGNAIGLALPEAGTAPLDGVLAGREPSPLCANVQPVRWGGAPARLVVLTDLSARKATPEELDSVWKIQLRMKDEFLSRVSHELRSPLNAVYQYVTILLDGLAGTINSEQREYLGVALRNVKQLRNMIGDLLDVTRSRSNKLHLVPCEMDVAQTVAAAVDTVRHEAQAKTQSLSIELQEGLPAAFADPQRVQQVLVNLLDNAIKFTPPGGEIRVSARVAGPPSAAGVAVSDGLEIAVSDSGCGIAEEDRERIFQHLYQVHKNIDQKRVGLGLGLFICRDLVSRLGGRIWVDSRAGEGSTFRFTLPAFSPELAVLALIDDRLAEAKAGGDMFSLVVVDADVDAKTVLPVWEALLSAVLEEDGVAVYAGKRFVVCVEAELTDCRAVRDRVRRLAKKVCFSLVPNLSSALSFGVAAAGPDTESAEALLRQAVSTAVSEKVLLAQKSVVVVDDEESYLRLLAKFISALGLRSVRTATSGAGLFALLEAEIPDLIVLDLQMQGMNGHEVIGRLKENPKTALLPIVVVSGYVEERRAGESLMPGPEVPALSKLNLAEVQRWVQYLL